MKTSSITINGTDLSVKEIKGQRVVSTKQIADLHNVDQKIITNNFNRNKKRFEEGIDFYVIKERNPENINLMFTRNYFTESGYLMLTKSLTDDLSWQVQRTLVRSYFKLQLLEQVLDYLPERLKKMYRYFSMGLSVKEVGTLIGLKETQTYKELGKLQKLGFRRPEAV